MMIKNNKDKIKIMKIINIYNNNNNNNNFKK